MLIEIIQKLSLGKGDALWNLFIDKGTADTDPLRVVFATLMLTMAHGIRVDPTLSVRVFSISLISMEDYAWRILE
jgi:hypothetical protein